MQATVSSHQFANGRAHTLTKRKERKKERFQDQCAMNPTTTRWEELRFAGTRMGEAVGKS